MFSRSLFASVLLASSMAVLSDKVSAPDHIPDCSTMCMTTKITEAAAWFGPGDLATYCTHPQFLVAYNNCLKDHCRGRDFALGQQAGAAACSTTMEALNATVPATTKPVTPTPGTNSTSPSTGSTNQTSPTGSGNTSQSINSSSNPVSCPTCTPFNSTNNSTSGSTRFSPSNSTNSSAANGAAASPANILRADYALGTSVTVLIASVLL